MSEQQSNIVEKRDLGNGRKQLVLRVDASKVDEYVTNLQESGAEIVADGDFRIGKGSVRNRYVPYNNNYYLSQYTSSVTPYTRAFDAIPIDPHQKILFAMELYYAEPIVGTSIDLMTDFSASGFTNDCEDQEVKKLFDSWCKEVKMQDLIEGIFLEFYRSGNLTIYRSDKSATVTSIKKSKAGKETAKKYKFPAGYTILNPMMVRIEGPLYFAHEVITLELSDQLVTMQNTDGTTPSAILTQFPPEFADAFQKGSGRIVLDPKRTIRITRKRQPYERYAAPFLERVFESVLFKRKLRQMDMSTIEGLVNQLVTVTIGNDDYPATDDDLNAISDLFNTPNKAYTIFWNHTLEVKFHKPEGIDTLAQDKYKQVNEDILAGLGISRVLLDGQGANFSTAWVSILSLIERLENARHKIADWIESEYKLIAEANGLKTYPTVRFDRMNLREDTYIRDVLLAMYDRGLIDEEDVITETGRDFQAVIEMKKRNKQFSSLFLPPEQPFQGGQSGPNSGRPSGPNKNGYKSRKPTPEKNSGKPPKPKTSKATASYEKMEEDYENELSASYESIKAEIAEMAKKHRHRDTDFISALIVATIVSMFKELSSIGSKFINDAIDVEFEDYDVSSSVISGVRKNLVNWNNSYVNKLANDIRDKVMSNIDKGFEVMDAIENAFDTNSYRVNLISQSGIVESVRQAKIEANRVVGNKGAIWIAHMDDKTCATCAGLDGQRFAMEDIPPRPHANCRCDLEFE